MIRNGVIDGRKEFAERRYMAEAGRHFEVIKAAVMKEHGVDIECCREVYCKSGKKIFAVVGDILIDTAYSKPALIENWEQYKCRVMKP